MTADSLELRTMGDQDVGPESEDLTLAEFLAFANELYARGFHGGQEAKYPSVTREQVAREIVTDEMLEAAKDMTLPMQLKMAARAGIDAYVEVGLKMTPSRDVEVIDDTYPGLMYNAGRYEDCFDNDAINRVVESVRKARQ